MGEEWITVMEAGEQTGIPTQTIRRYMNVHKRFLRIKKQYKSYYLHNDCIKVFMKIRDLYQKGKTQQEVEDILGYEGLPATIDMVDEDGERDSVGVGEVVAEIKASLDEQKEFNQELLKLFKEQQAKLDAQEVLMKKQQEFIETALKERDEKLLLSMREMQETRKMIASTEEQKPMESKSWFQKLFKK